MAPTITRERFEVIVQMIRDAKDSDLAVEERQRAVSDLVTNGAPELVRRVEELEEAVASIEREAAKACEAAQERCDRVKADISDLARSARRTLP